MVVLISAAALVLAGCGSAGTTDPTQPPDSQVITIEKWGVQLTLPDQIDPADVSLVDEKTDTDDAVGLNSELLVEQLDPGMCSGTEPESGRFLTIYRVDAPKDDSVQVGDGHFTAHGLTEEACYRDQELATHYVSDEVAVAITGSLTEA